MRVFTFIKDVIRGYFLAGLLVIVPLGITVFVIRFILRLMDRILIIIPPKLHPHTYLPFEIPGLGLLLALVLVLITGVLVKNYVGSRLVALGEYVLSTIPFVRPVYAAAKQLIHAMFGDSHDSLKRVVLVEYPRKGVYALAFVTGRASGELQVREGVKMISVFLPTTPNPTSGFYLVVPENETVPLSMSVEEAFKLLISGGVVEPEESGSRQFFFNRRQRQGKTEESEKPSLSHQGVTAEPEKVSTSESQHFRAPGPQKTSAFGNTSADAEDRGQRSEDRGQKTEDT